MIYKNPNDNGWIGRVENWKSSWPELAWGTGGIVVASPHDIIICGEKGVKEKKYFQARLEGLKPINSYGNAMFNHIAASYISENDPGAKWRQLQENFKPFLTEKQIVKFRIMSDDEIETFLPPPDMHNEKYSVDQWALTTIIHTLGASLGLGKELIKSTLWDMALIQEKIKKGYQ